MPTVPLREARLAQDWTQRQLAKIAGVGEVTVVNAEQGRPISPLSQTRLAKALGLEREDLFPEEAVSA